MSTPCRCAICGHQTLSPSEGDLGRARGNTTRYLDRMFSLWKCPQCESIHSLDPVDFREIYLDYPPNRRSLDVFARGTLGNLLKRLRRAGLKKTDSILDFGCGNGVMVRFLGSQGYGRVSGYDPYFPAYGELNPGLKFDCVIANDVIEHVENPRRMMRECADLVKEGGILYVGTADSGGVNMRNLDSELMRLHQPFHRVIVNQRSLLKMAEETGFERLASYRRSYMDTLLPFANYRFLHEIQKVIDDHMDRAFAPGLGRYFLRRPSLLFFAFFGYFFPSAYEPAVVLRRRDGKS